MTSYRLNTGEVAKIPVMGTLQHAMATTTKYAAMIAITMGLSSLQVYAFDFGALGSAVTQAIQPAPQNSASPMDQFIGQLGQQRQQPLNDLEKIGVTTAVTTAQSAMKGANGQFLTALGQSVHQDTGSLSKLLPNTSSPLTQAALMAALGHPQLGGDALNLVQSALGQRNDAMSSIRSTLVNEIIRVLGGHLNSSTVTALLPLVGL